MVVLGCIPPLCEFLKVPDLRLIMVALEGIENILDVRAVFFSFFSVWFSSCSVSLS